MFCFVIKAHFPSFHPAVITVELQGKRGKKAKYFGPVGGFVSSGVYVMFMCNWLTSCLYLKEGI